MIRRALVHSGVPLVEAVSAGCAVPGVWPPITTGGRRYVDGGMRPPVDADLAAGCERVVVLAPITRGIGPMVGVRSQVAALWAAGARVELVSPDAAAIAAIGRNVLDPTHRLASARAGRAQGAALVTVIGNTWSG